VVTAGVTLVAPLAKIDVNPPGLTLILAAPAVAQLNVLLPPTLMLAGLAAKEPMVGGFTPLGVGPLTAPAQPTIAHPAKTNVDTGKYRLIKNFERFMGSWFQIMAIGF
jgi:hypothetical protein